MTKSRIAKTIAWISILGLPVFAFQNCAGILRFGNGGGYEGEKDPNSGIAEKRTYVNDSAPACADGKPRHVMILTEGIFDHADLQRKDCQNLNPLLPVAITTSNERPWPVVAIYESQIFQEGNPDASNLTTPGTSPSPAPAPTPAPTNSLPIQAFCTTDTGVANTIPAQIYLRGANSQGPFQAELQIMGSSGNATGTASVILSSGTLEGSNAVLVQDGQNSATSFTLTMSTSQSLLTYVMPLTLQNNVEGLSDPAFGTPNPNGVFTNRIPNFKCSVTSPLANSGGAVL